MRPAYPRTDGALYRPSTTAACGTTTVADDSLGYKVDKVTKEMGFQTNIVTGFTGWLRIDKISILLILRQPVNPVTNHD